MNHLDAQTPSDTYILINRQIPQSFQPLEKLADIGRYWKVNKSTEFA